MTIVTVLVVRHPDSANDFTIDAPEGIDVRIVDVDLGSSFDGQPRNEEEAEVAFDMADSVLDRTDHLPEDNPLRQVARGMARQLQEEAREAQR